MHTTPPTPPTPVFLPPKLGWGWEEEHLQMGCLTTPAVLSLPPRPGELRGKPTALPSLYYPPSREH